jgi:hypothetical protein
MGRAFTGLLLAFLAGIAVSVRDLVLPLPSVTPLPLEGLVWASWILALLIAGWGTTQLVRGTRGVLLAPVAALIVVGVAIVAKQLRHPAAPITGDGFEILIWVYALIGLVGGALARLGPPFATDRVVSVSTTLLVVAAAIGAVPYLMAVEAATSR